MSTTTAHTTPKKQDWRVLFIVFWLTSVVEGLGVSQIFAELPTYLRQMGVVGEDRLAFIGIFSALIFVVGMPLVPLWGVWADKYSRKAVIVRSALVEAVVFACVALSREPWQLALSLLLIGLQLGNTGVMLAGIRDVTPPRRLGTVIGLFGVSGPIGFALGPGLAGILVDGLGASLSTVFWISALLSVGTALLVAFGSREVRPEIIPTGRSLDLAFGAMKGVLRDVAVRRIFLIFAVAYVATQMTRPYVPVLVEAITGHGVGLASGIALVAGVAALVGGIVSPLGGVIGDRIGFRPVLISALVSTGIVLVLMPLTMSLPVLAALAVVLGASTATVTSMVFGLLASEVPADRRSQTLNLVYLPLYAAGIIGPIAGAGLSQAASVSAPFLVGGIGVIVGAVVIAVRGRGSLAPDSAASAAR